MNARGTRRRGRDRRWAPSTLWCSRIASRGAGLGDASLPNRSALGFDLPPRGRRSPVTTDLSRSITTAAWGSLRDAARRLKVTPFAVALAGWARWTGRRAGVDDFLVPTIFLARSSDEAIESIGNWMNVPLLRARVGENRGLAAARSAEPMLSVRPRLLEDLAANGQSAAYGTPSGPSPRCSLDVLNVKGGRWHRSC